jgi:hypothetical protein
MIEDTKELMREGMSAYKQGRYAEAALLYARARRSGEEAWIRLLTHRPGALEQSLRAVERLAQAPAVKLLLDPGLLRFEPCVIPRLAQCRRLGIAHLRHAFEQARLAEDLQQAE